MRRQQEGEAWGGGRCARRVRGGPLELFVNEFRFIMQEKLLYRCDTGNSKFGTLLLPAAAIVWTITRTRATAIIEGSSNSLIISLGSTVFDNVFEKRRYHEADSRSLSPFFRAVEHAHLTHPSETSINLHIDVDGEGRADVATGIGFLDHMISQLCKFSRMSVGALCRG